MPCRAANSMGSPVSLPSISTSGRDQAGYSSEVADAETGVYRCYYVNVLFIRQNAVMFD